MPVYEVRLNETRKDKKTDEERGPLLADPVNVLAGSADEAIEVAKASAFERLAADFPEVVSKVSLEGMHRICDIDLRA